MSRSSVDAGDDAIRLLSIYLNDHRAGAAGGRALARRCASSNDGRELGRYLTEEFLPEVERERAVLDRVRSRFDVRDDRIKQGVARAAELAGRLKRNGRMTGYSPLSRIVELEGLIGAVTAKRQLWRALALLARRGELDEHADGPGFDELIRRADEQRERLEGLHAVAVVDALGFPEADPDE